MNTLRGTIRALFFLSWTALLVPPYLLLYPLGRWVRRPFVSLWHRGVCLLIGMKVIQHGTPFKGRRLLLAGNHISYLDIPVLAACMDITFVAKADIANWPLFGFLAKIAQTAFIERKPSHARKQKRVLQQRILNGENLMIFPEGTSTDGTYVKEFKSSLFEMVMEKHLQDSCYIQPVTICLNKDTPSNRLFAWYGDMTLVPHLWAVFGQENITIDVLFHAPAKAIEFNDRKELADWVQHRVQSGLCNLQRAENTHTQGINIHHKVPPSS